MKTKEQTIEDASALINQHLDSVRNTNKKYLLYYAGFINNINSHFFPLLSDEELKTFKKEYAELVNRCFPEL